MAAVEQVEDQPLAILTRTLDLLATEGWCQRSIKNTAGERCLFGGMSEVSPQGADVSFHIALEAIRKVTGCRNPVTWNDHVARTWDDVRTVLLEAIRLRKVDLGLPT